ncbi:cholinephosphotransferase [Macrolepiota fuliginosa MF-IS2]|uniref:Cholinephosphotransferase n=1 Tax=Macrolepiota fuliginosa MF-IS2 TaxID=1400762 RepID=A0A9P5XHR1_9AGAR|nr:cholinephosphotransferase [Macrolepiota fuliginosa MF-IS2]
MGKYLSERSLENLKKYAYRGADKSLVSRYILNPWWNWLVTLWPLTVAPNAITLTGLSIVFFNFLTLVYYDPLYLTEKDVGDSRPHGPPQWVYFTWAIGLFVYQSLDAIDGKQARRTGMAGPLGEMFDHGCDALNTTLEVILASRALGLGRSWWTVASEIFTLANFYLTTWEEYHTGVLFLGYFSGPVEGILIIVTIYIVTGFCGTLFWETKFWTLLKLDHVYPFTRLPNLPLNESFMVFAALGLGINILHAYLNVYTSRTSEKVIRAHTKDTNPLTLLLPFLAPTVIQIAWLSHPAMNHSAIIHSALFVPFLCAWGLQFAHQVGRMILAHVTLGSEPFPRWDWVWAWSVVGAVDANLPRIFGRAPIIQTNTLNTTVFVWLTLAVSFFNYGRFVYLVIYDITEHMGIACLTVRKKDDHGHWVRPEKSS